MSSGPSYVSHFLTRSGATGRPRPRNVYAGPVLRGYLESLTTRLADVGFGGVLLVMQSNGGVALPEVIREPPATTLLSGPAAGPRAAAAYAGVHGREDCIVVDMGGTSFDASLVRDGAAAMNTEGEIDRLRIALPILAIATIGAGGGSIGWTDEGGLLRMGPASAGALPGPACYGRGGEEPTCTDADLVLGYLDPDFFAGGKLPRGPDRARQAIGDRRGGETPGAAKHLAPRRGSQHRGEEASRPGQEARHPARRRSRRRRDKIAALYAFVRHDVCIVPSTWVGVIHDSSSDRGSWK